MKWMKLGIVLLVGALGVQTYCMYEMDKALDGVQLSMRQQINEAHLDSDIPE